MGEFDVLQRTSDGMFNATTLLKQWNGLSGQKKMIAHYFENNAVDEFINALMLEENLSYRNSVVIKSKANKGENAGTWMHPLLFIDFAMWVNPKFKVKVLRFVYDELIKYRNDAGDAYKKMASGIANIVDSSIMKDAMKKVAKALNYVVYNTHESNIRNKIADEDNLKEMYELEKDIAKLIRYGYIKNFSDLINHLRNRWCEKWQPKILKA